MAGGVDAAVAVVGARESDRGAAGDAVEVALDTAAAAVADVAAAAADVAAGATDAA